MSKSEEKKIQNQTKHWLGEEKIEIRSIKEIIAILQVNRGAAHKASNLFIKQKLSSYQHFYFS